MNSGRNWARSGLARSPMAASAPRSPPGSGTSDIVAVADGTCPLAGTTSTVTPRKAAWKSAKSAVRTCRSVGRYSAPEGRKSEVQSEAHPQILITPRGCAPRTPQHARSRGPVSPAPLAWAHSRARSPNPVVVLISANLYKRVNFLGQDRPRVSAAAGAERGVGAPRATAMGGPAGEAPRSRKTIQFPEVARRDRPGPGRQC